MPQRPPLDIGSALLAWALLQGAVVSVLLVLRPVGNRSANRWLALLVATVALTILDQLAARHGHLFLGPDGRLVFLTLPVSLLIGPVFYRYAHALLARPFPARRWWGHGLPALLAAVNQLPTWIQLPPVGWPGEPTVLPQTATWVTFDGYAHAVVFTGLIALYVVAADRLLRDYGPATRDTGSRSTLVDADRIRVLAAAIGLAAGVFAICMTWIWVRGTHIAGIELVMALGLSTVVHLPGILTLWRPDVYTTALRSKESDPPLVETDPPLVETDPLPARADLLPTGADALRAGADRRRARPGHPPHAAGSAPRYGRSGLDLDDVREQAAKVRELTSRDRLYLDPDLRLGDLARAVGLTPNQLSQVLNQGLEVSFFDFVNGYRVREVQRRLRDPEASSLTHLALALEAGFSSKSSFHRIFRKHVGQTPKEYARGDAVHREAD